MADQKISQLTELTSAADIDVIPIVDISGNETKKIEVQNLIPTTNTFENGGLSSSGQYGVGSDLLVFNTQSVTAGSCYSASSGGWVLTNASSLSVSNIGLLGVAPSTGQAADGMIIRGFVYLTVDPGGAIGDVVYLSTTPGQLTTTPVASPNNVSRVVGYKVSPNIVFFDPSKDWIEIS
jgi:hypothetical protein